MKAKTKKTNEKFDFKTIKTFSDACKKLKLNPKKLPDVSLIPEEFKKAIIAAYKLMIIYKAINNGWQPDWANRNQYKYYPWFEVWSSGFGFSHTYYHFTNTTTNVGSRLCTDMPEKALFVARQFESEYADYMLFEK